jgi:hypothetical protein
MPSLWSLLPWEICLLYATREKRGAQQVICAQRQLVLVVTLAVFMWTTQFFPGSPFWNPDVV